MPDLFYLFSRWWKQLLTVVALSLIAAMAVIFLAPKKYLSVSTALPASSYSADKGRIFNENIEALYSVLGSADELDMITGTGKLDTLYLFAADQFNLQAHYTLSERGEAARQKAATLLKKNSKVMKSEYGELKVKVWDKNKDLAAQLANALMNKIQLMHSDLQNSNNLAALENLIKGKEKLIAALDSVQGERNKLLSGKLLEYDKMIAEYQLMADSKPPALLIIEKARPAAWPDNPKPLTVLLATLALSFLFAVMLVLLLERKKNQN